DHGRIDKYRHGIVGRNSRLDGMQAAVLSVKLRHLDAWNAERRRAATALTAALEDALVIPPVVAPGVTPVFHLYVIRTEAREGIQAALAEAGIASGIHYPLPLHLQPAFAELSRQAGYGPGSFPVAEAHAPALLSLPIFPELTQEEIERICAIVTRVAGRRGVLTAAD